MPPTRTITALATITRAHPTARKWLLGPTRNWGREALLALARQGRGWIGWEAMTLRLVAQELAFVAMAEQRIESAGDVALTAIADAALDEVVAAVRVSGPFARLARGMGFRRAVRDAVGTLRVAGLTPSAIRAAAPRAADVALVLEAYERRLLEAGLADPARLFELALAQFDAEAPHVLPEIIAFAPTLRDAGLPGALLARLQSRGARALPPEPVVGLDSPLALDGEPWTAECEPSPLSWLDAPADAPAFPADLTVDLFRAATPSDEVREVMRRVLEEKIPFEHVELVATDRDTYAVALECLTAPLGIRVTSLHGLPFLRTRLGRALDRWLRWLEDGLPADMLREAIEAGELVPVGEGVDAMGCARLMRELSVGWGIERWRKKFALLESEKFRADTRQGDDEPAETYAARCEQRLRDATALAALLGPLIEILPPVPERGAHESVTLSVRRLAEATRAYLARVPELDASESLARGRVDARLAALAALPDEPEPFGVAVATVRGVLAEQRAWLGFPADGKPWAASGGALHLTDLAHAGATGRPRTFVLGLDADRTAGARQGDPILDDGLRLALGAPALPTTRERSARRRWELAHTLASLRGHITLSYASSGDLQGREVGPAPALLQAYRIISRTPSADYDTLRRHFGNPCCAVSVAPRLLDVRDAWLAALKQGDLLADGEHVLRAAFPGLDMGLRADEAARGAVLTPHHGLVAAAAGALDPRVNGRPISPSSLEVMARCPLSWFYDRGLGLRPDEEPVYDPDRWLSAKDRGSLLHEVFQLFVERYLGRQEGIRDPAARAALGTITEAALAAWRERVPPPSDVVFDSEAREIRQAAASFLAMEIAELDRNDGARWKAVEAGFGYGRDPARLRLPGGEVLIRGRIDRVDTVAGGLLIVDYKTGGPSKYKPDPKQGPFNGGRNLQPAIYVAAAGTLLGDTVTAFEYRFPAARGEAETVRYRREETEPARDVIEGMLEHAARGTFLPTLDKADCTYCDHRPMCRVQVEEDQYVKVLASPRAEWAELHALGHAEYERMCERRLHGADE